MRLAVLRTLQRQPYLDIVAMEEVDVPLREVLGQSLHPFRAGDLRTRRVGWLQRRRVSRSPGTDGLPVLRLRGLGGRAAERPGFLVYRSRTALIDLVLRRWEPGEASDALSNLVRRLRRDRHLRRADRSAEVEAFLRELEDRPGSWAESSLLVPGEDLSLDDHDWMRLQRQDGSFFARVDGEPLLLAVDHPVTVGPHRTCRRELLVCQHGDEFLHIEGATVRRYTSLHQVPASVVARFDELGRALADVAGEVFPHFELWPTFLLVVPPPSETPPGPAPVGPAWLVEPWRIPHVERLDAGLPVLEGDAAAAVLARVSDGIVLPGQRPRQVGWTAHPPGTLLVGALPFSAAG